MTIRAKKLSWKPVRKGDIYCSPACGHNCTYAAYQAANQLAKKIAAELGPAWRPKVHENMGWHARAELSTGRKDWKCEVYINPLGHSRKTWASLWIGNVQVCGDGRNEVEALRNAVEKAGKFVKDAMADFRVIVTGSKPFTLPPPRRRLK